AQCYWQAYPGALDPSRVHIIPNGFEGTIEKNQGPDTDKCTILYSGTLSSYRYETLLAAFRVLKKSDRVRARLLRLRVVGEGVSAMAQEAQSLDVSDIVET